MSELEYRNYRTLGAGPQILDYIYLNIPKQKYNAEIFTISFVLGFSIPLLKLITGNPIEYETIFQGTQTTLISFSLMRGYQLCKLAYNYGITPFNKYSILRENNIQISRILLHRSRFLLFMASTVIMLILTYYFSMPTILDFSSVVIISLTLVILLSLSSVIGDIIETNGQSYLNYLYMVLENREIESISREWKIKSLIALTLAEKDFRKDLDFVGYPELYEESKLHNLTKIKRILMWSDDELTPDEIYTVLSKVISVNISNYKVMKRQFGLFDELIYKYSVLLKENKV